MTNGRKKRGPGRPVGTTKDDSRRRKVTARFSDAEYAQLQELATREVLNLSDVIREATLMAIARGSTR